MADRTAEDEVGREVAKIKSCKDFTCSLGGGGKSQMIRRLAGWLVEDLFGTHTSGCFYFSLHGPVK
jgi:hypothetical protein